MRHLIATFVVASVVLVAFTGCEERSNMRVAPNRDGHAWFDPANKPNMGVGPVANPGEEIYHNWRAQDTLSGVAKTYNMSVEELIKRNQLKNGQVPKAGDQVIVKKK
jgi:hypothetical protein